jgi:hypothetical protein
VRISASTAALAPSAAHTLNERAQLASRRSRSAAAANATAAAISGPLPFRTLAQKITIGVTASISPSSEIGPASGLQAIRRAM